MNKAVVFYDSECLMCSTFVKRIIRYDVNQHFQFASLSSNYAKELQLPSETVVVVVDKRRLTEQHAVRYIVKLLPKVKWTLFFFWITPKQMQNWIYKLVAKNRKRIFGSTQCGLAQEHKNRFIS